MLISITEEELEILLGALGGGMEIGVIEETENPTEEEIKFINERKKEIEALYKKIERQWMKTEGIKEGDLD